MKLTVWLLTAAFFQVQARGLAQPVTIAGKDITLKEVFSAIESQTGYYVFGNKDFLANTRTISLNAYRVPLKELLEIVLRDQPLDFELNQSTHTIILSEKKLPPGPAVQKLVSAWPASLDPQPVRGKVTDSLGQPVAGASVRISPGNRGASTGNDGQFLVSKLPPGNYTIEVTLIGHLPVSRKFTVSGEQPVDLGSLVLLINPNTMANVTVYNTGYYDVPKERATGSFTHIDKEALSRSTGTTILERLEGLTNGLQFIRKDMSGEDNDAPKLRVRGLSTIESDESPLIVVDNFPYTGNINSINPEDIESVTVLKDAAAASIWGAKAGNGVIVITTLKGRFNRKATVTFTSNIIVGEKPDLFYSRRWLPSETVMNMQKELWEAGAYNEGDPQTGLPDYVNLLIAHRDGKISETDFLEEESIMKATDARNEALKYFYRNSLSQQYSLNVSGGSATAYYHFSGGYNKSLSDLVGNESSRINLSMQNTFKPVKPVELTIGMWLTENRNQNNGLGISGLNTGFEHFSVTPYNRYADEDGNALPITRQVSQGYLNDPANADLLDWQYRPLDEIRLSDKTSRVRELRLTGGARVSFLKYFNFNVNYQFLQTGGSAREYYSPETWYVRNLVNRYTQADGTQLIPYGGILRSIPQAGTRTHAGRAQLNFQARFASDHEVAALVGGELRQSRTSVDQEGGTLYNYDKDKTTGTSIFDYVTYFPTRPANIGSPIPGPTSAVYELTDRDLSYFGNLSYTYKGKYILSGSARYDGSNLFGVKTNQKGTPLWSVGGNWDISKEPFYRLDALPYLRLRATYGVSGNVNKSVTHYPTITYMTDYGSNLDAARIRTAGNPALRWEKVYTVNAGVDFASANQRISGSIEYYVKNGKDLIGNDYMAPSVGVAEYKINYASLVTRGVDLTLNLDLLRARKPGDFSWSTSFLFNYAKNKITSFNTNKTNALYNYLTANPAPVAGRSRDVVYSLPFYGLSPDNGQPIVYIDGEKSFNYLAYYNRLTIDDLLVKGYSIPPFYGSVRSMFSWKGFQLDFLFTWKANYLFYRTSMNPTDEYQAQYANYHVDYFKRWQKPGDEQFTNVPGKLPIGSSISYMAYAYSQTEALLTKGDHIRLQDVRLDYSLPESWLRKTPFNTVKLYVYARNLGIVWRANRFGIDPDLPNADYPLQRSVSFGLTTSF